MLEQDLKCKEKMKGYMPHTLKDLALKQWINTRKDWDPELALHLCKVSRSIRDTVFECDVKVEYGRPCWTYQNLRDIVVWEKARKHRMPHYTSFWYRKPDPITVKLQDIIENDSDDELEWIDCSNKRVCRRLF